MRDHVVMVDGMLSQTIAAFFARTVEMRSDERALGYIRDGQLHWRTWQEVADAAMSLATELKAAGIAPGNHVAHVSENRYEWIITDLALHMVAAVHVPIHVTLSGQQIAEQIHDSGAKLVFVSNEAQLSRFATYLDKQLTIWTHDDHRIAGELRLAGASAKPQAIANVDCDHATPADIATILYTSGTTGCPRGVMLSHENLASNAAAVCEAHQVNADHTMLCILPLSHIYARTCDLYTWIVSGSRLVLGENRETLLRDCQIVQPTALNAVPFVYQRVMDGICNSTTIDKQAELRSTFGGRMENLFCGGAPAAPNVEAWYADHGLPLLPGYGLTEASPVIAVTTRHACRLGTVGQAIPGIENRIAPDGELLTRGPHVMLGYWQNAAATAEVIRNGWLHTGDLAEIDPDGFLTIRGRKKELIVLSTGKKVAPTRVEALLTASPLIDQAAVFGDGHCGLTALIVPAACGLAQSEKREAISENMQTEITRCLAHAAHEEQIHRFTLLDRPFSIERGELTAKLSLCRSVIARNFAAELSASSKPWTG
jgi:long-chain acyl-CoA synthetase